MAGSLDARSAVGRLRSMGFQSKLLIMLLLVSVLSVLIVGVLGYISGTSSLRSADNERLTQLREARDRDINSYYQGISNTATVLNKSKSTITAVKDFTVAFAELQKSPLPPGAIEAVDNYYASDFGPELAKESGQKVDPELYKPTSTAQIYLQSLYTAPSMGDFEVAVKVLSAGDPSEWSKLNARYQPLFGDFTARFDFDDALLLDTDGNIVYTVYKGVELGANVLKAPYTTTKLAEAYRKAMRATSVDEVIFTDFESYAPSYGQPTPWVVTPIGDGSGIHGVLALQLSTKGINEVMTGNRSWEDVGLGKSWEDVGLGKSGETYLVGPDKLMRSLSRELLEDPERFRKDVVANGTPEAVAQREVYLHESMMLQPVHTNAVDMALAGQSGVTTDKSYTGRTSLVAYDPLNVPGLDWVVIASIDESEALAPVSSFARKIALSTAAIVLAVCLLSLLFSRILTRPVQQLVAAVRKVSGGEFRVTVPITSNDEFGELAAAFNDMSASLQTKQQLIDEQRRENDKLLSALMPEPEARRYRDGEENISTHYRDASVIYAQFIGFDEFSRSLPSEESVSILNSIVEAFGSAAERQGVEQVRSMQDNSLLATCGVVVPRVDHASRTIAFATELAEIVARFNAQHGAELAMRAGIDSGPVTSGLVGERSTIYALWGEAVDLAHRVHSATKAPGIFVSDRAHDTVTGIYSFSEAGTIADSAGTERVWQLDITTRQSV